MLARDNIQSVRGVFSKLVFLLLIYFVSSHTEAGARIGQRIGTTAVFIRAQIFAAAAEKWAEDGEAKVVADLPATKASEMMNKLLALFRDVPTLSFSDVQAIIHNPPNSGKKIEPVKAFERNLESKINRESEE